MAQLLRRVLVLGVGLAGVALAGCAATPTDQDKKSLEGGFASYSQRQYPAAERAASAYIKKFPTDRYVDEAYYLRGLAQQGTGNRGAAEKDLAEAIAKTDRADLKVKANRAMGDMAFGEQRFDAAIGFYQASMAAGAGPDPRKPAVPPDAATYERLGESLQNVGKWGEAKAYFDRALASGPEAALAQRAEGRRYATGFQLQFGVFADAVNARTLVNTLKGQGIAATLVNETRDGKVMWFVRAGSYATLALAETARKAAVDKKLSPIVVP